MVSSIWSKFRRLISTDTVEDAWQRYDDDEKIPHYVPVPYKFVHNEIEYTLTVSGDYHERLIVECQGQSDEWRSELKFFDGKIYKFRGMAYWGQELTQSNWTPNFDMKRYDVSWFELVVAETITITYWGNQVIHRIDTAI